jgi:hypothetical protein
VFRQIVNYFGRMVHDIIDKTYVKYNQSLLFIIIHMFYCIITASREHIFAKIHPPKHTVMSGYVGYVVYELG